MDALSFCLSFFLTVTESYGVGTLQIGHDLARSEVRVPDLEVNNMKSRSYTKPPTAAGHTKHKHKHQHKHQYKHQHKHKLTTSFVV